MNKLISVIIPVFNGNKFIARCLDTIVAAKKGCLVELIIVDDGSSDNSLTICQSYSRQYNWIKVFSQLNAGPSSARNRGLEIAKGELITFVDIDDYVSIDYFDNILKEFDNTSDILIFGYFKVNGENISKYLYGSKELNRNQITNLIGQTSNTTIFWFPHNKVYKAELLKSNNAKFNPDVKVGEDTLFNLQLFVNAYKIKICDLAVYYYVTNEGSLTQLKHKPYLLDNMISHFQNRLDIHNKYQEIQGATFYQDIANYYIEHILFLLFNNISNGPRENICRELKKTREARVYKFSFNYYKFNHSKIKMKVLIFLFKYQMFSFLGYLIKK